MDYLAGNVQLVIAIFDLYKVNYVKNAFKIIEYMVNFLYHLCK